MPQYTTPIGLTSQFSFCGLPLRLDTYAGCALSCTYCFARLRGGNSNTNKIRFANPIQIINRFKNSNERPGATTGLVSELIRSRQPIHFGGMSDPFQPIEQRMQITKQVLEYLCLIKYPLVISTRSPIISQNAYLEILNTNPNVVVQFSFSTLSDKIAKVTEPFAYSPSELLKAIEKLSTKNIITTVRWQPYIPGVSEQPKEFVKQISSVGIRHIAIEHLKLPLEKHNPLWKRLATKLNFDILQFYKTNGAYRDGRELILPTGFKIRALMELKSALSGSNITVGAADNDLQHLSDSDCCCSGVDQFPGFENWNKYQIGHAIKKSEGNRILYSSIAEYWRPQGSIDKHLNSKSRIKSTNINRHLVIDDYILERWENLDSEFNPTKYFGIEFNGERDINGLKVFDWNEDIFKYLQL